MILHKDLESFKDIISLTAKEVEQFCIILRIA